MPDNPANNQQEPRRYVERRRKKDWVVRSVNVIAVLGWLGAVITIVLADRAKPGSENMFIKMFGGEVVTAWNTELIRTAFISILISFFVCAVGLLVNMTRHKRKTDRFNKSIIILGIISFILIVIFITAFFI